jgi:hypothetical protein
VRIIVALITVVFINVSLVFSQVTIQETIIFNAPDFQDYSTCTVQPLQNLNFGNITQGSSRRLPVTSRDMHAEIYSVGQNVEHGIVKINCPYEAQNRELSIRIVNNKLTSSALYKSYCDLLQLELTQSIKIDAIENTPISSIETSNHCVKEWAVDANNGKYIHIGGTLTIPSNMPIAKINTNLVIETYY